MRYDAIVLLLGLMFSPSPAAAQVSIGIGLPGVSIGINLPSYPTLVVVPNYPVYYAPRGDVNLFFYDGMYWAYERDNWYASSWYNGPWGLVGPEVVPVFVLRVPVRYYRHPPVAWAGWRPDGPPRWGERWGHDWEQRRNGWDRWDRHTRYSPAPLPVYQRQYSGNRYPPVEQQQVLLREKYRYEPKEPVVREHFQQQRAQSSPGDRREQGNQGDRRQQDNKQQNSQRSSSPPPPQPSTPAVLRSPPSQGKGDPAPPPQVTPAVQGQKQQPQPAPVRNEEPPPKSQGKGQGKAEKQQPEQAPEREQGPDREQGQERGQGRNK
jgi:hypothetical protein